MSMLPSDPIEALNASGLSGGAISALLARRPTVDTIQKLLDLDRTQLLAISGIGEARLHQIREALAEHDLCLSGDVPCQPCGARHSPHNHSCPDCTRRTQINAKPVQADVVSTTAARKTQAEVPEPEPSVVTTHSPIDRGIPNHPDNCRRCGMHRMAMDATSDLWFGDRWHEAAAHTATVRPCQSGTKTESKPDSPPLGADKRRLLDSIGDFLRSQSQSESRAGGFLVESLADLALLGAELTALEHAPAQSDQERTDARLKRQFEEGRLQGRREAAEWFSHGRPWVCPTCDHQPPPDSEKREPCSTHCGLAGRR